MIRSRSVQYSHVLHVLKRQISMGHKALIFLCFLISLGYSTIQTEAIGKLYSACQQTTDELLCSRCKNIIDCNDRDEVVKIWTPPDCLCLSPFIGNLSKLREIDLGNSSLSGTIPTELGRILSLENLDLEHNLLTGSILSYFKLF
jgi:hypothetical protein